jgi:glycogen debranching enzyme
MDADEVLRISDRFYILTTSARIDDRTRVLKYGDVFAVFDRFGDVESTGTGELGIYGLYDRDTRHLSRFRLRLASGRPLLLSSVVKDDNGFLTVDLMNPDLAREGHALVPRGTVHIFRAMCLWEGACQERLRIHNYGAEAVDLSLLLEFAADFADIFEVRGLARERRGRRLPAHVTPSSVCLSYEGLDDCIRRTRFAFDPAPARLEEARAQFDLHLGPRSEETRRFSIACESEPKARRGAAIRLTRQAVWFEQAAAGAAEALERARTDEPEITTSNEQFNDWLNRSRADLHMMRTETAHGPYPYAGVPWFSTAFGRDGIITALQCLWINPALARGVLRYLAATQADADSAEQDAQPGKVLHETRAGEMAATGEVPFSRYYGSVDATPLFVTLAGAYYERTGDLALIREIWPNLERALGWIDVHGDPDGDGFVEYSRRSARGLVQQGWKDSQDSVFHRDGSIAEGPIALCEVQAVVFAAWQSGARLAEAVGESGRAPAFAAKAETLRRRFDDRFWCEELGTYALALDGSKRRCEVRTYHNGSVWPHDNSLIAAGFARYGLRAQALRVMTGLFDASLFFDLHRLPELFCGFPRRPGEGPTRYPVSCSPQAWASGSALLLLQSCLSVRVLGAESRVVFSRPLLPEYLQAVSIRRLRVRDAELDLAILRHGDDAVIEVPRKRGDVEVVTIE